MESKRGEKLYFTADLATNEVLEATAKKQGRKKSNIASVVMSEWASGQYPNSKVKPEKPENSGEAA